VDLIARVDSVRRATPSTRIIRVALDAEFPYLAGQAALIGPAGSSERLPFSIASAPEETAADAHLEFLIKTDEDGRWGSSEFAPLGRGARLAVSGPVGSFTFPEEAQEHSFLFIAGGTGISPVRSMLHHVLAREPNALLRPDGTRRRVSVLYSARTPDDFAYGAELRRLARRGEISLVLTATRQSTPRWRGKRGRIVPGELALLVDDAATLCFVCGPASMVADVPVMLQELGIDRSRIRIEEW
jgi:ferredoxin-NADP reductase